MLAKRIWLQHFWFFGQHCNEWQNESQSRLRSNLVSDGNLCHINIIVVQTGKLIFVRSEIAAPLNFAALFGRTPRTCLRPALGKKMRSLHFHLLVPISLGFSELEPLWELVRRRTCCRGTLSTNDEMYPVRLSCLPCCGEKLIH